ncbi:MAG: pilus assembly protein PilM [Candidatus Nealsonbacteria bacterium]|nr:pilus assembly protein PilM [Candidatus Nealsonbacteria bacterium]
MLFSKPAFGLDISDSSIEIVSLGGSLAKPRLLAMGRQALEPGIFINGKVFSKEGLKKSLKGLLENLKFGKLGTRQIVSALPESKSYLHIFEKPADLGKSEIPEYAQLKMKENFPYSPNELYSDFQIQGNKIILAASPKKVVDDYLEVFRDCDLEPLALEIESLSLSRSLLSGGPENVLIIDLGARTAGFSVFQAGELGFGFSLEGAGDQFTQALSGKLGLTWNAAENLKKEVGLDPGFQEGKVFLVLQKELQPLVEQVGKISQFFQDRTGEKIGRIILAGGSSSLPNLPKYLAENFGLPVEIGDPWVKISIDLLRRREYLKEALEVNPILYSTVIGNALRGLEKNPEKAGLNLLPRSK